MRRQGSASRREQVYGASPASRFAGNSRSLDVEGQDTAPIGDLMDQFVYDVDSKELPPRAGDITLDSTMKSLRVDVAVHATAPPASSDGVRASTRRIKDESRPGTSSKVMGSPSMRPDSGLLTRNTGIRFASANLSPTATHMNRVLSSVTLRGSDDEDEFGDDLKRPQSFVFPSITPTAAVSAACCCWCELSVTLAMARAMRNCRVVISRCCIAWIDASTPIVRGRCCD